ncbi:MAG: hypothetical protein RLZZ293_1062 [Pseudomonadota bacterium]
MKKFLLIVLCTTSFINIAHSYNYNYVGIHIANKTESPIYLLLEGKKYSNSCTSNFNNVATVQPGLNYKFWVSHKPYNRKTCYFKLLGFVDKSNTDGMIAFDEKFSIQQRNNHASGGLDEHVYSHDTPPSKCGLGMTCSTHLRNSTMSLYITVSNKNNQYAQVKFYNTKPEVGYVKFERLRGNCSSNLKNKKWRKALPKYEIIDYIRNTHKGKICTYRVSVWNNNKHILCNTDLKIGNDAQNNSIIESAFGNCNVAISNNKWSANINVN